MILHESLTCPYCWQTIEIEIDASIEQQEYVEDCSVCCRPIVIRYRVEEGSVAELEAVPEQE
ncbi:MAG TPA: CPXCG motif-containing cysteine-rich protein [Gammaproteobacteria bacterium]|nr:CPXCG motif-containing cysteine-rich protein [Gammaproteobacteria bacterium]